MNYLCDGCSRMVDLATFALESGTLLVTCPACGAVSRSAGPAPAPPSAPPVPAPPAPAGESGLGAELESQWVALLGRWSEPDAHRAFIERAGLEGQLAEAGRRYRARADAGDAIAVRARDDVVRKAIALAQGSVEKLKIVERRAGAIIALMVVGLIAIVVLAVIVIRRLV